MYLTAETVTIDDDEGRLTLEIMDDEGDRHSFIIHHIDLDAFYDQVKGRIGPWLRERDEARQELDTGHVFRKDLFYANTPMPGRDCTTDCPACFEERHHESGGYAADDPKHPQFHSIHADIWDSREGK